VIFEELPTPCDLTDASLKWAAEVPLMSHLHVNPSQLQRAEEIVARHNAAADEHPEMHEMKAVADPGLGPNSWYICWAPIGSKSTDP
jgi:hypothetical protein